MQTLSRREAIKKVALLMGGALALPDILQAWENPDIINPNFRLTPAEEDLIAEIAETILPATDTPGAKGAGVPKFITKVVADCYEPADRDAFYTALKKVDQLARDRYARVFVQCAQEERVDLLKKIEADYYADKKAGPFWGQIKDLTVTGYFTSEVGCTQALRYEPVPGRYDGEMPYKKGDKAWAT
ncbi:MAG: gluconate 2-dehydrogenase subunit 3 family protein [Saprospiraceae bacterium]